MEAIYFNTFDEYEKNLELVKTEIQESQPSWLHYWFYRYLQISPYYWAMHLKQSKLKEDQERYTRIQKFNNDWEKIPDIKNDIGIKFLSPETPNAAYKALGDVWNIDFARWWYSKARYFFMHVSDLLDEDNIRKEPWLHMGVDSSRKLDEKLLSKNMKYIEEHYRNLYKRKIAPKAISLTINLQKNKKETIKAFSQFIDGFYGVEYKNMNSTIFHFSKSKFTEATLRDCYKVYEMSIRQDKLNLFQIGIKANVIRGASAEYQSKKDVFEKNIKIFRSYNSLRSATSRQIRYAKNFALNAGYPTFPYERDFNWAPVELPMEEKRYIFDYLLKQSKFKKNQKNALLDFAKNEILKNVKKEYLRIMGKLD